MKAVLGGALAYAGLLVLLMALSRLISQELAAAGVDEGLAIWAGPAIVGTVIALVGVAIMGSAKRHLRKGTLTPKRTIASLKEDKAWTKEKLQRT